MSASTVHSPQHGDVAVKAGASIEVIVVVNGFPLSSVRVSVSVVVTSKRPDSDDRVYETNCAAHSACRLVELANWEKIAQPTCSALIVASKLPGSAAKDAQLMSLALMKIVVKLLPKVAAGDPGEREAPEVIDAGTGDGVAAEIELFATCRGYANSSFLR